jgi:hypothetical protein
METKTINILLIEDNPDDVHFLRMVLHKASGVRFKWSRPRTWRRGLARLAKGGLTSFCWI